MIFFFLRGKTTHLRQDMWQIPEQEGKMGSRPCVWVRVGLFAPAFPQVFRIDIFVPCEQNLLYWLTKLVEWLIATEALKAGKDRASFLDWLQSAVSLLLLCLDDILKTTHTPEAWGPAMGIAWDHIITVRNTKTNTLGHRRAGWKHVCWLQDGEGLCRARLWTGGQWEDWWPGLGAEVGQNRPWGMAEVWGCSFLKHSCCCPDGGFSFGRNG